MKTPPHKVGDKVSTWVSGREDGLSTILEIKPYTGLYQQWFSWVYKLTADNTRRGYTEMAVGKYTF